MLISNKNKDKDNHHELSIGFKIGYGAWMSPIFFVKYSLLVIVTLPSFLIMQLVFVFNDKAMLQTQQQTVFSYIARNIDQLIANSIALAVFFSLLILLFPMVEKILKNIYFKFFYRY